MGQRYTAFRIAYYSVYILDGQQFITQSSHHHLRGTHTTFTPRFRGTLHSIPTTIPWRITQGYPTTFGRTHPTFMAAFLI
jgi:hypothetical protein